MKGKQSTGKGKEEIKKRERAFGKCGW